MLRGREGNLIGLRGGNHPPCPRCNSPNTKFCYYNNYSVSQPRHYCKSCKRYWTRGGIQRNVPVGGGHRRFRRHRNPPAVENPVPLRWAPPPPPPQPQPQPQPQNQPGQLNLVPAPPAPWPSNPTVTVTACSSIRRAFFSAPNLPSMASASSAMQYQVGGFVPSLAPTDQTSSRTMNVAGDFGVSNGSVLQGLSFSFPSFNRQPPQEITNYSGGSTWPGGSGPSSSSDHSGGGHV